MMSLDPVQVMKDQEPVSLSPSSGSNGDSKASWGDNEDFCDSVCSTKKPNIVSLCLFFISQLTSLHLHSELY